MTISFGVQATQAGTSWEELLSQWKELAAIAVWLRKSGNSGWT